MPDECDVTIFAWAPGMDKLCLPLEAGVPFGGGDSDGYVTSILMQVHLKPTPFPHGSNML